MVCLVLLCAAGRSASASAGTVLRVDPAREQVALAPALWLLEDPGGSLVYDDVVGPVRDRFQPLIGDALNAGYSSSTFWLRCEIELPSDAEEWLLERRHLVRRAARWRAAGGSHRRSRSLREPRSGRAHLRLRAARRRRSAARFASAGAVVR
jgi:hypothetical protein